jgi:glycosyltransferase involved in cell wall biosynthesis
LLSRDELPHHLVFAGRRVSQYLASLGFHDADFERVHFIEFVPYEDLPKLYACADMSLMTAYYDGCSTAMMESLACGCPVIASTTGASREIGADAALYADPRDPADFAECIRRLNADVSLRSDLRVRGVERAAFFYWRRTAELTLEGLRQAARQSITNQDQRETANRRAPVIT